MQNGSMQHFAVHVFGNVAPVENGNGVDYTLQCHHNDHIRPDSKVNILWHTHLTGSHS